jgi:hypothetical protein
VLVGIGGLAAGILGGKSSKPTSRSSADRARAAALRARRTRALRRVSFTPNLEGGAYGWCLIINGGGTCPILPTAGGGLRGALIGTEPRAHTEIITLLLSPEAAAVLVDRRRVPAVTIASLPYRLRAATITIPRPSAPVAHTGNGPPPPPGPGTPQSLIAVDPQGQVLRSTSTSSGELPARRIIWWERPSALPHGPCQIHAHGIPALQPQWGHVATSISPYPERIIGRAFYSCIDTEYYLHNWPLETAILLDAQHPGSTPAAIPGLKQLRGAAAFYNGPGDSFHGAQTAVRKGDAWLIVAGGSGLAQRREVLEHLTATVKL